MAIAKFDHIEIPYVRAVVVERESIEDAARTAGGNLRSDVVAIKKTWELQTTPMKAGEANTLTDYLESTLFAIGDFWLEDFGGVTKKARVDPASLREEVVSFGGKGGWQRWGRQLTFKVVEQ